MDDDKRREKTPELRVGNGSPGMRRQNRCDRRAKGLFVLVRIIAFVDALTEVLVVGAVGCPGQNRLVVLIDAGVIGADTDTQAVSRRIKRSLRKSVPSPLQDFSPLLILLR